MPNANRKMTVLDEDFYALAIADQSLAPLSGVLNLYIGWALRYWGVLTCLRTGWSTRLSVEVGIGASSVDDATEKIGIGMAMAGATD